MKFSIIAAVLAAASNLVFAYPAADRYARSLGADELESFDARGETWGQGKYTIDLHDYHSHVKPGLKQAFAAAYPKFASNCGSNPDFHCDRKGFVSASAVDKKKASLCTNSKFPALHLGDSHVLPYVRRSPSPAPSHKRRSFDEEELAARAETWGQGKYTIDLHDYHSHVKPGLKQAFAAAYPKFASNCGSNPDFHCDRKGFVSASAVDKKKASLCTNSKFPALHLGDSHVLPYVRRSPSPAPSHKRRSFDEEELAARAETWGQGKYTIDLHDYHSHVKPGLKQAFAAAYPKFASNCGSNPDFHCDRKGFVSASAVDKKKASLCTNSKFPALHLGDSHVLPYVRRSPSPAPSHKRRSFEDFEEELY